MRKNLEFKVRLTENNWKYIQGVIAPYFKHTLRQDDEYFEIPGNTNKEKKLKLRTECIEPSEKQTFLFVKYDRPMTGVKLSKYYLYPVEDMDLFQNVFGEQLKPAAVNIQKTRKLYLIKNARIHLDEVFGLGKFLEIEIVISNGEEDKTSLGFMKELHEMMKLGECEEVRCGYEDLFLQLRK